MSAFESVRAARILQKFIDPSIRRFLFIYLIRPAFGISDGRQIGKGFIIDKNKKSTHCRSYGDTDFPFFQLPVIGPLSMTQSG